MKHRFFIPIGLIEYGRLEEMVYKYHKPSPTLYYKYVYVLHYICWYRSIYKKDYDDDGAPVNAEVLYSIIGREHKAKILENLSDWGLLDLVRKHKAGEHSRHYKLGDILAAEPMCIITVNANQSSIVKKLKLRQKAFLGKQPLLKHQLHILQHHVTLSKEGLQWIKDRYKCAYVDGLVDAYGQDEINLEMVMQKVNIQSEDLMLFCFLIRDFFTPSRPRKGSRVYTALTSLKREYRQFLLMDGKPIFQTDLVNSQIVFSIPVVEAQLKMMAGKKKSVMPKDVIQYKKLAQEGKMYEAIAEQAGIVLTDENRKKFKKRFFEDIFFSRPSDSNRKIKKAFYQLFPSVVKAINGIKAKNYTQFALRLQKMEASIMITVLKQLQTKDILCLSIHDSIVVNNEMDMQLAEELILKLLNKKHGVAAQFKKERPVVTLPAVAILDNENKQWLEELTGQPIEGKTLKWKDYKIEVRTLKVLYPGRSKSYSYKRKGIEKLINKGSVFNISQESKLVN